MANHNTICVAEEFLPCSKREAREIQKALQDVDDSSLHGFQFDFEEEEGQGLLIAEESGTAEELPEDALMFLGALITNSGKPYLEVGCAFTCSRQMPGAWGGTAFRIMPDGRLVHRKETWDGE